MTEKAKSNTPEGVGQVQDAEIVQEIETDAYVPTYKVKPELKQAVLQAIGDRPFNEIAGLINAINVEVMDHNTLTQIINVIGQFPYVRVETLLGTINQYVEQVIED